MQNDVSIRPGQQQVALWGSTLAFAVCFAVWTIFSIIGVQIKQELGLNDTQFGLLVATPILTGSLSRVFLGIWTEQYGGRIVLASVMLVSATATWLMTSSTSYPGFLLAALGIGIAGGSFAVGVTYVAKWFPPAKQGTALGAFGAGNVGATVTAVLAPVVMIAYGWPTVAKAWALVLTGVSLVFFFAAPDEPSLARRRAGGDKPPSFLQQLVPLKKLQVWRFGLYYFFVFGGFVALVLWLPRYLTGAYGLDIRTAGLIAASYSVSVSLLRIAGGWLSDRIGARRVMYWTFGACVACTFLLSYPTTTYVVTGIKGPITFTLAMGVLPFTVLVFVLGLFMPLGMAAVYKHIPVYYPNNVGAVGGVVGMIGGLGGFFLPIAFGALNDLIGVWTSCFMLLFALVAIALVWMHFTIRRMDLAQHPEITRDTDLPELMAAAQAEK